MTRWPRAWAAGTRHSGGDNQWRHHRFLAARISKLVGAATKCTWLSIIGNLSLKHSHSPARLTACGRAALRHSASNRASLDAAAADAEPRAIIFLCDRPHGVSSIAINAARAWPSATCGMRGKSHVANCGRPRLCRRIKANTASSPPSRQETRRLIAL